MESQNESFEHEGMEEHDSWISSPPEQTLRGRAELYETLLGALSTMGEGFVVTRGNASSTPTRLSAGSVDTASRNWQSYRRSSS